MDDFAELLSIICRDFSCVVIVADFNVHVKDSSSKELCCILDDYGPSKWLNISKVVLTDVDLSDHSCVFFEMICADNCSIGVNHKSQCYITENTSELFRLSLPHPPTLGLSRSSCR